MNERLGRAVLDLTVEDGQFDAKLDKAERRSRALGSTFDRTSADAKRFADVSRQLGAALDDVFGVQLEQRARASATGIMQVGGATKLTDAEAKRHLGTLNEWIAKSERLGREVSPHILQTRDALQKVNTEVAKTPGLFDTINTKSVALGAAIGSFIGNIAWSAVNRLGAELGTFVERGSRLPAVQQSFERLSSGAGQSSREMRATLRAATQGMVADYDLMTSANKAMLLGLPVSAKSMGEMANAARVLGRAMGQDATKSLDDMITALGRSSPLILDNLGLTVKVGEANQAYADKLGKTVDELTDAEKKTAFYEKAMEAARAKADQLGNQSKTLSEQVKTAWTTIGNVVTEKSSQANQDIGRMLTDTWNILTHGPVDAANMARQRMMAEEEQRRRQNDPMGQFMLKVEADLAAAREVAAAARVEQQKKAEAAAKKLAEETKRLAAAEKERLDQLTGAADIEAARVAMQDLATAATRRGVTLAMIGKEQQAEINKTLAASYDAYVRLGKAAPDALITTMLATSDLSKVMTGSNAAFEEMSANAVKVTGAIKDMTSWLPIDPMARWKAENLAVTASIKDLTSWLPKTREETKAVAREAAGLDDAISQLSRSLADLSQVAGGSFGAIAGGLATLVGSFDAAGKSIDTFKSGLALAKSGDTMAGIAGMATGIAGIVAAALAAANAIKSIWNALDRNKGRDLVVDFADSMGGFDALHAKLATLGPKGEELWIALTQGVGRNNPAQARAAIDAITEAFAAQEAAAASAASAQVDTAATITEAQQAALDAVKKLDDEYKSLAESIADEAPEEVMGVIEAQARARMEQIEKEKAALEAKREEELAAEQNKFDEMLVSGEAVNARLRELFAEPLRIPIEWDLPDTPTARRAPGASTGGVVTSSGISTQYRALGGPIFQPRGSDTVPVMLTPGEGVLNTDAMSLIGVAGLRALNSGRAQGAARLADSDRALVIEHTTMLDGRVLAKSQRRHLIRDLIAAGI